MSPLGVVLLVVLVLVLFGGIGGPRFGVPLGYGAGYYGIGGVGLVLVILIVLLLLGRL